MRFDGYYQDLSYNDRYADFLRFYPGDARRLVPADTLKAWLGFRCVLD